MTSALVVLLGCVLSLPKATGKAKSKSKLEHLLSKTREVNILSAARFFLFGARDIWCRAPQGRAALVLALILAATRRDHRMSLGHRRVRVRVRDGGHLMAPAARGATCARGGVKIEAGD